MKLGDYIDTDELHRQIMAGNISERRHPRWPLAILNYTTTAMGQTHDNLTLRRCRGLIYNIHTMEIVARPMEAFFNVNDERYPETMVKNMPENCPMEITEKMDGSLGIVYQYEDNPPEVATRGSFESEQAKWATKFLNEQEPCFTIPKGCTVLLEIIYPENQIVVDYGNKKSLTLFAVIENDTGKEWAHWQLNMMDTDLDVVKKFDKTPIECVAENEKNREGYVAKFFLREEDDAPTGRILRVKIKFDDYRLAHRAMYGIHNRDVWEVLARGEEFNLGILIPFCPPSLVEWLSHRVTEFKFFHRRMDILVTEIVLRGNYKLAHNLMIHNHASRKDVAEYFKSKGNVTIAGQKFNITSALFARYDGKNTDAIIWKLLRPVRAEGYKGVVAGHHDLDNGGNRESEEE